MGILILVRRHLYIETVPRSLIYIWSMDLIISHGTWKCLSIERWKASFGYLKRLHIAELEQERHNFSALAMELLLSCTNPSILAVLTASQMNDTSKVDRNIYKQLVSHDLKFSTTQKHTLQIYAYIDHAIFSTQPLFNAFNTDICQLGLQILMNWNCFT